MGETEENVFKFIGLFSVCIPLILCKKRFLKSSQWLSSEAQDTENENLTLRKFKVKV